MKIGILGYGKEGQSAEQYFTKHSADDPDHPHELTIIDNFTTETLNDTDFSQFDLVLRSPSVHPRAGWSSVTQYFFDHCPCLIIGVTGTKGKGTTSSLITALLKALQHQVYLVGNIGSPAIDVLDQLQPSDIVVYEMSSFQLWDLTKSPQIAVVLGIEPDHLNVHDDYNDYVQAKANIAKHQTANDTCIYYSPNSDSSTIAAQSAGHQIAYPLTQDRQQLDLALDQLSIPGQHNRDNAEAALLAVAAYCKLPLNTFLEQYQKEIATALQTFQGLPHRLQFLRSLNKVDYYDDNFSTTPTSLQVALDAFPERDIVLIAGGRDKTNYADLPEILDLIHQHPNIHKVVLIGESGHELHQHLADSVLADSLSDALDQARTAAEQSHYRPLVLMSPAAASFDMFDNVYDRGAKFQALVQELK